MKKITLFIFLLIIFCLTFLPVKDTDFGWHYRCGNQFLTTGKLCLSNEFSYYLPNYKAYYSGHLYDILLAFIYNHGGFVGVSIVSAIIISLSAYIFAKLVKQEIWLSFVVFVIAYFFSSTVFNLGLRPQIVSFFFTLLLLYILQQKNKKLLIFIPLLFFFWVNLHIGFFIGLIILVIYYVNDLLRLYHDRSQVISEHIKLGLIIFASFVTTLINPFGVNIYKEIFNHALAPLNTMIAEWVSPSLSHIILMIVLLISSIIIMIKNKSTSLFYLLLLVFFTILAFTARRNLPYFYFISSYILLKNIKINLKLNHSLLLTIAFSILIFLLIIQLPQTIEFGTQWNELCKKTTIVTYPCTALQKYPQLSGNVYANYEWGGFLIWRKPNIKVFVDGRMSAWKAPDNTYPYQTFLEILQTKNNWNEKLRKLKTNYILIGPGTFLDLLLQKESRKYGWKEKYRDNVSVIYQSL